jgi:hypothetical protein
MFLIFMEFEEFILMLLKCVGLWQWYINITITILDIIHRPAIYLKTLRHRIRSIGLSVPHGKHITSPLRAQQVNVMYRFETMKYWYNYRYSDIINRPVFYFKHDVSKTGFCTRFQVGPTQLGPYFQRQRLGLYIGSVWVGHAWRRLQNAVSETSYFM